MHPDKLIFMKPNNACSELDNDTSQQNIFAKLERRKFLIRAITEYEYICVRKYEVKFMFDSRYRLRKKLFSNFKGRKNL